MAAKLLPLLSAVFIAISGTLVACGWYHIVHGHRKAHQRFMVAGAIFALLFFTIYMSRTLFIGNTNFADNSPEAIKIAYYIFLLFHIVLATVSAFFGIITLTLAFKQKYAIHKKIGRWTATMWLITASTGIMVYLLLYIFYPGGKTKPLWDIIFGK